MYIDTNQVVSMTEANQNFSKVAKVADQKGAAVIFKNNKPKYLLLEVEQGLPLELTDDEKIDVVAKRILERHRRAFEVLAK